MEQQHIKPRRILRLRSKQEISKLMQAYEASKSTTTLKKFCEDHHLPTATFYSWQKQLRKANDSGKGRFMELPAVPLGPVTVITETIFASLSSGDIKIYLHQYVEPAYIKSLLGKPKVS